MKLITISGLDGSGKSTQIQLLKSYLENQGRKVFYFHATQFSIANIFLCHCERSAAIPELNSEIAAVASLPRNDNKKSVTEANWLQIQLRKIAMIVDIWRFNKLYKNLEKAEYDYILSDRYFYDTVVNIEYLKNSSLPLEKGDVRRTEGFLRLSQVLQQIIIPKNKIKIPPNPPLPRGMTIPTIAFYLQSDPKKIMQRERKPDQGIEYLKIKKALYDAATASWNLKVIDGNRSKEKVFEELKNLL